MSARLLAAISAEIEAMQHFSSLLETEQKLLINGDADAVLPLLEQKNVLVNQLGSIGQERESALREIGIDGRKEAVNQWLQTDADEGLRTQWQRLMEVAETANQLNVANGKLINTRLQYNHRALAVLLNAASTPAENTYGPDGHPSHASGSRPLGSA